MHRTIVTQVTQNNQPSIPHQIEYQQMIRGMQVHKTESDQQMQIVWRNTNCNDQQ
jgi:hypothetical protein